MKNLLLNLSPSTNSSTTLPPRRGKPLALAIPPGLLPTVAISQLGQVDQIPHLTNNGMFTPINLYHNTNFGAPICRSIHLLPISMSDLSQEHLLDRLDLNMPNSMLQSPFGSSAASAVGLKDNLDIQFPPRELSDAPATSYNSAHSLKDESNDLGSQPPASGYSGNAARVDAVKYSRQMPEELQEQSNLHAYPDGPANVLNSVLYLYSDPRESDLLVDINEYDLVINVAKECPDLTLEFDTTGDKQYMYIPWSHTSSILQKLPELTAAIAKYDTQGKKILVHCQCGVLRSACVIVAYFMMKFNISVNEAYELLKSGTDNTDEPCNERIATMGNIVQACDRICPNMSLIFELMDFGERLTAELATKKVTPSA